MRSYPSLGLGEKEALLENNPDLLFGVFCAPKIEGDVFESSLLENVFFAYANRLPELRGIEDAPSVHIIDLGYFLKEKKVRYLKKGASEDIPEDITYMSVGVVPLLFNEDSPILHTLTTTRDSLGNAGLSYTNTRNGVAGRSTGSNLIHEGEREWIEESPLLGRLKDGSYALAIPEVGTLDERIKIVENALSIFLREKFFPDDSRIAKEFNKRFGIDYASIPRILEDIISKKRYIFVGYDDITRILFDNLPASSPLRKSLKRVIIDGNEQILMVHYDPKTGGYETRRIVVPHALPKEFRLMGRSVPVLFTESRNQIPHYESLRSIQGSTTLGRYAQFARFGWEDIALSEADIQRILRINNIRGNVVSQTKNILEQES